MKLTARNTHRDIAYFYVGLIISFALSGIAQNHRKSWNPARYTYEKTEITLPPLASNDSLNRRFANAFAEAHGFDDDFRKIGVEDSMLSISYTAHDVKVDLRTGKGKIEHYRKRALLAQMTQLHKDTSSWWIYYSDAFAVALFTIALTGMFINKGSMSFASRGWKLALAGIIFPLIFLFLLS